MALIVGLTGGIGSGKSTVADRFLALGADLVDADQIAHEISRPGACGWQAVRAAFGEAVLQADGELDRPKIRSLVFGNPEAKTRLEAALHPLIGAEITRRMAHWRGPYGLLMVPLMIEGGRYRSQVDRLLVVDCPEEEQIRRVKARSGLKAEEVRAIMAAQASRAERLAAADDVIDNAGPPEAIDAQVRALDEVYRALGSTPNGGATAPKPRLDQTNV